MASSNCIVEEGGGTALLLRKLPNDRFPFPVVDGPASAAPWGMGSVVLTLALFSCKTEIRAVRFFQSDVI